MIDSATIHCPACRQSFSPPANAEVPCHCSRCGSAVVGRCCDLGWIGGGAMGDVYRGRQADMGNRSVAIKVPKAGQRRVAERFEREIVASARLKHENVVCAYDRGEQLGRPFLVMEFVAGRVLRDVVEAEHPLSPRRVGRILLGVARGLAHADQQGIVNRDLKPDNIILTSSPDETAKILDYGLALIADIDGTAFETTRSGVLLGTPGYLAPEQAADSHNVTIAADVYALGCTAFYCLTKHAPFSAASLDELRRCHAEKERPSLRELRPDVPADLERLVQEMMSISHSERPSPAELVIKLDRLVPQLNDARPVVETPVPERLDVVCPSCGETYHFTVEAVGKRFKCRNKLCQHRFEIEMPVAEALVAEAVEMPAVAVAEPYMPEIVEAVAAEAAEWPAPSAGEQVPMLPMDAIVAEPVSGFEAVTLHMATAEEETPPEIAVLPTDSIVYSATSAPDVIAANDLPPPQLLTGGFADLPPAGGTSGIAGEMPPIFQATAFEEAVVDNAEQTVAAAPPKRRARLRVSLLLEIAAGCLLLGLGCYVGWGKWDERRNAPEKRWQEIQDIYSSKRWTKATKEFLAYKEQYPDAPHAADVPFFVKMCEASEGIYSTTGDPKKGLAAMQTIFKDFRDSPSYNAYAFDLYKRLQELINRFTSRAKKRHRPADIASAREARELLGTVAESLTDPSIVENTKELDAQIAQADREVQASRASLAATKLLTEAADPKKKVDLDETYRQVDQLLADHPDLVADKKLMALRKGAEGAETQRVRYIASTPTASAAPVEPEGDGSQTIAVVWDAPDSAPPPDDRAPDDKLPKQVAALANGVLYVFDRSGKILWCRRLGVDSERLPSWVAATTSSPDAFIASSSEDRALLSLNAANGEVLWRAPTPGVVTAPLTIVSTPGDTMHPAKRRGLLPTAGGAIHVFELVLGKRMGIYQVGQPLNVGGTFDENTGLVFFPAEAQRVFAIDPAKIDDPDNSALAACRSVLITGHASGALRSEPLIVGRYFVLIDSSELEEMRLTTYEIGKEGFSNPRAEPFAKASLPGWSWFAPQISPDRATLVTDRGELGLFGFNLDNPGEEAIYPLVVDEGREPSTRLAVRGDFRAAAVHAEEHLVWVLVDGKLQKLAVDLLDQKLKPQWKGDSAPTLGIPVHEPQSTGWDASLMFYLTTMSYDGRQFFTRAVAGESGEIAWQRQLGINPLVDPLAIGEQTIVIDRSGRLIRLSPDVKKGRQSGYLRLQPHDRAAVSADLSGKDLMVLYDGDKPTHLAANLGDGHLLAVRSLESNEWRQMKLPEPMQGRPCIVDGVLVVPCANGKLHRMSMDDEALRNANENEWQWARQPSPKSPHLVSLGKSAILLVDGAGLVRRLEFATVDLVPQWRPVGDPFSLADELIAAPLVSGDRVFLVERSGKVHAIDGGNPARGRSLKLAGRPSGTAVLRGGRLLVVLDRKKLMCIDPSSDEAEPTVAWSAELTGRICGAPVLSEGVLLVTDESRHISGLRLSDGERLWSQALPVQVGPAAAAVPFGKKQLLVPLRDGTLLTLPMPAVGQEVAEVLR